MERLWTKPFLLLTMGNLVLFIAFYMLYPTLPLYIQAMGGNESQVGLAMGVFALSAVVFRPLVGGLLDRFGRRIFMLTGLVLFTFAMLMYNWVWGIAVLVALRILHGLSWALSSTAMITSVTDLVPDARRGEGMGWFTTSMTLAMALGPMIGLWLTEQYSFQSLFLVGVIFSAGALFLTLLARLPEHRSAGTGKIELVERSVLPLAVTVFLLFIGYGGITAFVPLFAGSIQVHSGLFFLTFAASLGLSRPVSGKLSDRYGEKRVILPALLITTLSLIVLSLSTGPVGIIIAAILYGIGFGSAQPAFISAALLAAPPERRGVANATMTTANDLGIGLGSIMLGWVSQYTSYPIVFAISAGVTGLSIIGFYLYTRGGNRTWTM